jgi:hypothetical protein
MQGEAGPSGSGGSGGAGSGGSQQHCYDEGHTTLTSSTLELHGLDGFPGESMLTTSAFREGSCSGGSHTGASGDSSIWAAGSSTARGGGSSSGGGSAIIGAPLGGSAANSSLAGNSLAPLGAPAGSSDGAPSYDGMSVAAGLRPSFTGSPWYAGSSTRGGASSGGGSSGGGSSGGGSGNPSSLAGGSIDFVAGGWPASRPSVAAAPAPSIFEGSAWATCRPALAVLGDGAAAPLPGTSPAPAAVFHDDGFAGGALAPSTAAPSAAPVGGIFNNSPWFAGPAPQPGAALAPIGTSPNPGMSIGQTSQGSGAGTGSGGNSLQGSIWLGTGSSNDSKDW